MFNWRAAWKAVGVIALLSIATAIFGGLLIGFLTVLDSWFGLGWAVTIYLATTIMVIAIIFGYVAGNKKEEE